MTRWQRIKAWFRSLWRRPKPVWDRSLWPDEYVTVMFNTTDEPSLSRQVRRAIARQWLLAHNRREYPDWSRRDIRNKALRGIWPQE